MNAVVLIPKNIQNLKQIHAWQILLFLFATIFWSNSVLHHNLLINCRRNRLKKSIKIVLEILYCCCQHNKIHFINTLPCHLHTLYCSGYFTLNLIKRHIFNYGIYDNYRLLTFQTNVTRIIHYILHILCHFLCETNKISAFFVIYRHEKY